MQSRVLVCNLGRLGDIVQTQPVIDDLHAAGYAPLLLCLGSFAPAARLVRNLAGVCALPGSQLLLSRHADWDQVLGQLLEFVQRVRSAGPFSHVINLTPTPAARLLVSLIAGSQAQVLGYGLDKLGYGLDHGAWSSFLAVGAHGRSYAPLNLADMQRGMLAPLDIPMRGSYRLAQPAPEIAAQVSNALDSLPTRQLVAFQPGASAPDRQWPIDSFRELGKLLSNMGWLPVLVGSPAEKSLAKQYAQGANHAFADLTGETSLPQLAALLQRCRLLVTNDTGTMHLAAGMGTPALAIFLATAQPWDTAPQGPGSCCLIPALPCYPCEFDARCPNGHQCRRSISVKSVAAFASAFLENGDWNLAVGNSPGDCHAFVTAKDTHGYNVLLPMAGQTPDERILHMAWLGVFWRNLLDSLDRKGASPAFEPPVDSLSRPLRLPAHAGKSSRLLQKGAVLLQSLQTLGANLGSRNAGQAFLRSSEKFSRLFLANPALASIGFFWLGLMQSAAAENLAALMPKIACVRRALQQFGRLMERQP